ncbi:MAG: hypothetical protein ACETWK_02505 [Candidatus Aminicenantaceae bacterium]
MRKLFVFLLALFLIALFAFCLDQTDEYASAVSKISPEERIKAFKEYLKKFSDSKFHKYVYANLALNCNQLGKYMEAIFNAEKALEYKDLEPDWKVQMFLVIANSYASHQEIKDFNKALNYADKALNLSKSQGFTTLANAASNAKNIIYNMINKNGVVEIRALFENKQYEEVIDLVNKIDGSMKDDFAVLRCYAFSLYRTKRIEDALKVFEKAYSRKKTGEIANSIAIIQFSKSKNDKKLLDISIEYFVRAGHHFLKEGNQKMSEKATARAQHLFFNEKYGINGKLTEVQEKYRKFDDEYGQLINDYNAAIKKNEGKDIKEEEKKIEVMEKRIKELESVLAKKEEELEKLEAEQRKLYIEFQNLITSIKSQVE